MNNKMNYTELAKMRMAKHNDPAKAEQSVRLLDRMLLEPLKRDEPHKYWRWMRKDHEIYNGPHFDEEFAKWEVDNMYHTDAAGKMHKGEHWSLTEVSAVYTQHKAKMPESNVYDVYVALNANYHDKIELFSKWFADKAACESKIIEDALTFYFMDPDAVQGKIWHYMNCMRK